MEHYVTLFDGLFLPQGLALHQSMQRHSGDYTLWILCMDDEAHHVLSVLQLPNVRLLRLSEHETPELLAVKSSRTKGEYCWTLTPFSIGFVLGLAPEARRVTYLDADTWFLKNPSRLFLDLERAGKSVLITDHGYAPEHDQSATSGQYCVQFMVFSRGEGETVLQWWQSRCLEWCYNRAEDGKFGDQKYLDDWPDRFAQQVHELSNKEWTLAPWNATRFPHGGGVLWHFHGLRLKAVSQQQVRFDMGSYPLPKTTVNHVYKPYVDDLGSAIAAMRNVGGEAKVQAVGGYSLLRRVLGALRFESWRLQRHANIFFQF